MVAGRGTAECSTRQTRRSSNIAFEQTFIEVIAGHRHHAGFRDEELVLELDAFTSTRLADIAFDADDHAGLQDAIAGKAFEIAGMGDNWFFTMHADTMDDRRI